VDKVSFRICLEYGTGKAYHKREGRVKARWAREGELEIVYGRGRALRRGREGHAGDGRSELEGKLRAIRNRKGTGKTVRVSNRKKKKAQLSVGQECTARREMRRRRRGEGREGGGAGV